MCNCFFWLACSQAMFNCYLFGQLYFNIHIDLNCLFLQPFMKQSILLFFLLTFVAITSAKAQMRTISGVVYDISGRMPIEAVMVYTKYSRTQTDSLGRYLITIQAKDSLTFSLFGKNTQKFSLDQVEDPSNFNIMIHVTGFDLPEVRVRNSYYRYDSIQNRIDYAKYFNYEPPGLKLSNQQNFFGNGGVTIGFDVNEIINMFRFKRNRNLQFLQNRLLYQEQEKYINYRFTKRFVQKLTKLDGIRLDLFMEYCKPSYPTLALLNDLELGYFIQQKLIQFNQGR